MAPTLDSLLFLLGVYWPFMTVAAAVGLVTGWWSLGGPHKARGKP